jgi:hypothetical protein
MEPSTAVLISSDGRAAYFGDLQENMYGVKANTGALLWKTRVGDHLYAEITGTPKPEAGRLYVPVSGAAEQVAAANLAFECCMFRGNLKALDAASGKLLWKTYTIADAPKVNTTNPAGTPKWGLAPQCRSGVRHRKRPDVVVAPLLPADVSTSAAPRTNMRIVPPNRGKMRTLAHPRFS